MSLNNFDESISNLFLKGEQNEISLGLNRIKEELTNLGSPCNKVPAIQIVGTNGKGSIASFLSSTLELTNIDFGLTTSPHLISWCERIKVNRESISEKDIIRYISYIRRKTTKKLTPFEYIILTALLYFSSKKVKLMILEAGLGGRLDATTAHPFRPIIAIGGIGIDHCEYLGNKLADIAKEKAAVITRGSKVFSGEQHPDVKAIIENIIKINKAEIRWVKPLSKSWNLGINGEVQLENASVAREVLRELSTYGWVISEQIIKDGFSKANWPGRMQKATLKGVDFILDGAHNPHAAKQLAIERNNWDNQEKGVNWIFGFLLQKDAATIIRTLIKPCDNAWIIPVPNQSSWNLQKVLESCPEFSDKFHSCKDLDEIIMILSHNSKAKKSPKVITGSLYLIGKIIDIFEITKN